VNDGLYCLAAGRFGHSDTFSALTAAARIGIDIGGTFTDVVYGDGSGDVRHAKVLTTPDDVARGILEGLDKADADPGRLELFLHGTTVALNAFLERKTPTVGLITTSGFRDVLEIMRTNRPDMYDLQQAKPEPLVPRRLRRELSARCAYDGSELVPVDPAEVRAIAREFAEAGVAAVAVCLLHSYADPAHERAVRELLQAEAPELFVSLSSDLSREWREFERTSTTVVNAATAPIMAAYLERLERELDARGFGGELLIMQSSGGVMPARDARVRAAATLMSGPVGGVVGAEAIGNGLGGETNLITLDIGGTSADVAILDRGRPVHAQLAELERWPILMPMVDIRSIGAGGGSIARVDAHGGLSVGPESAGASPGPACYGRGGTLATVTDANLVLGRIDGARFLDGALPLNAEAAARAVERDVGVPFGMTVEEAAEGIVTVLNSNMSRLLRDVLVERGFDPREFTLLAFGGGGALHACALADEADLARVVVPPNPGTLSAYGIYSSDIRHDHQAMYLRAAAELRDGQLEEAYDGLVRDAVARVEGGDGRSTTVARAAELRYAGQEYTLRIDGSGGVADCTGRFHDEHERLYGFARRDTPAELVKLMVSVVVSTSRRGDVPGRRAGDGAAGGARTRTIWEGRQAHEAPVYERVDLAPGSLLAGPCVVEEPGATTFVGSGWHGRVDEPLNLVLTRAETEA
jgi:N-methylhydantoinase A